MLTAEHCELDELPDSLILLHGNRSHSMQGIRFSKSFAPLSTVVQSGMPLRELPGTIPTPMKKTKFFSKERL